MGRTRLATKDIEHIALGEGDWVDLRILNYGDRQAISGAMVEAARDEKSKLEAGNVVMLHRAIVAWGGPGFGCTCSGGCRCDEGKPPHSNDCHVIAITVEEVRGLDDTGDVLLRLVDAKQDQLRMTGNPFLFPRDTSPSSAGAAEASRETANSPRSSTSGSSSRSGTSTPEPQ